MKLTFKNVALGLFMIAAAVDVITLAVGVGSVHQCIKPILIPLLALYAVACFAQSHLTRSDRVVLLTALAFHTAGDVLLMFDGLFIPGAAAFLVGHILYFVLFVPMLAAQGRTRASAMVVAAAALTLIPVLIFRPTVGALMASLLGVYALMLIINAMCGLSGLNLGVRSAWMVLVGAVLFIVSDSVLASNVFLAVDFPGRGALVMLTYLAAQALLVEGVFRTKAERK